MIFHCYNHGSLPDFSKPYPTMENVDNKLICHPKSITVFVCCQIFVVKGCFLYYKIRRHFYMESIVYPYVNILEGPGNYFSLHVNDYTDVLYFIEHNCLFICKTFFLSVPSIIRGMHSFFALGNISG